MQRNGRFQICQPFVKQPTGMHAAEVRGGPDVSLPACGHLSTLHLALHDTHSLRSSPPSLRSTCVWLVWKRRRASPAFLPPGTLMSQVWLLLDCVCFPLKVWRVEQTGLSGLSQGQWSRTKTSVGWLWDTVSGWVLHKHRGSSFANNTHFWCALVQSDT